MRRLLCMIAYLALTVSMAVYSAEAVARQPGKVELRNIRTGSIIYERGYCDQPYVVITKEGDWLCVFTTNAGREGQQGQYIVATVSKDKGQTWSKPVEIEPPTGPEASWAMPLVTPSSRVYVFYDYNGDNIRTLNGKRIRADVLGWYCYKYSDDNGQTWSKRYRLPVRLTACDLANDWKGQVQIMWGIGKPIIVGKSAFFAFTKIGKYMLDQSEGWFFRSDNILMEANPKKIKWQMLPDGEKGLRTAEHGSIQAEQNLVALADGGLYCMYRTKMGYPCHAYSRDGGHSWSRPEAATYTPSGRKFKHPRACPRIWRTGNGKFLFWFHNHGGKSFKGRNPAWICGGVEKDGYIYWSQPEILLYDENPETRMSYPDLIEQDGRYWVTETQKTVARVHEVEPTLLEGLWNQGKVRKVAQEGLVLSLDFNEAKTRGTKMPELPNLADGGGFSIDFWIKLHELSASQVIVDSSDKAGKGFVVRTTENGTIRIDMNDGKTVGGWDCDPELIKTNTWHHIAIIVDGGPKIITFVVDGVLCDGGTSRQYGWGRFSKELGDVSGSGKLQIAPSLKGQLKSIRLYGRYLRTSEAVGNFRAGQILTPKNAP